MRGALKAESIQTKFCTPPWLDIVVWAGPIWNGIQIG